MFIDVDNLKKLFTRRITSKFVVNCTIYILYLSGLNLMEGKLNKEQWQGSLQNLMMPKLNRWAETSPNPSAKADPTIVYISWI